MTYSRDSDLSSRFNRLWNDILHTTGVDYLSNLTTSDLTELKLAISNINNIITHRVSLAFVEELGRWGIISNEQVNSIKHSIDVQHPNSNGYDIQNEGSKILAEVKCNIPVLHHRFGSAQCAAIRTDLNGLRHGKPKGLRDTSNYRKFLVLHDIPGVQEAMNDLCRTEDDCVFWDGDTPIDTKHIYIVFITSI